MWKRSILGVSILGGIMYKVINLSLYMVKHSLFTLSILLVSVVADAAPITIEKAQENALTFLTSGKMRQVKGNRSLKLAYTQADAKGVSDPLFHVFNIDDGNGFVIASADDIAVPVLGYCDSGEFDADHIPENMQEWLEGYSEEIGKARANGIASKQDTPANVSRKMIEPMLKSKWGQDAPFNDQCIFDSTRCLTGCVATAMAQVMYYWATTGINGKTFKCGSTPLPAYSTKFTIDSLEAVTSFDWDSMTDGTPTTTEGKAAVAKLMRYCGQSVTMTYWINKSSANTNNVAYALLKYFNYNWNMQSVNSWSMTEQEWQEMVYNELYEGKPFLMSGGFHAFICDGYDPSTGNYHFNWGFNGDLDGWFAMTALTPGNYNFTSNKAGIKGIQPLSSSPSPYAILSEDGKTLSFYCDTKRKERAGTLYPLITRYNSLPEWHKDEDVEHVIFDSSFSKACPTSTRYWFDGKTELQDIVGLSHLNTSSVNDMERMFCDCWCLESLDVSHFDTSYVYYMDCMFKGCERLEYVDVSNFNTSNVYSMDSMFYYCTCLKNLDVSHFNTSKVSNMSYMFAYCYSLKSINVSHFDMSNVFLMDFMFYKCEKLKSLDIANFDISKAGKPSCIADGCKGLQLVRLASRMKALDDNSFYRVGSNNTPCKLVAPANFDFGFTPPTNEAFTWKGGTFILVDDIVMGDVNIDGQVSVTDVMQTVNHILGKSSKSFINNYADINEDNKISVSDVMQIVNIILK